MRKGFFITLFLVFLSVLALGAQENTNAAQNNTSPFSYENIPVYQILNAPDAYVVIYAKYTGTGQIVIPKSWTKSSTANPAKLVFRELPKKLNPYMTLIKKDGEFYKVYLTVSLSRSDAVWGQAPHGLQTGDLNKTTLDIEL